MVRALKDMGPTKALVLDGFHAIFFQKNCGIVGLIVMKACLGVLHDGDTIKVVNSTNIVLISKKKDSKKMADFFPISFCNVI